ncbi:MAG TPA: hypothetical protein GX505_06945 [Clostridiales bacterium]|nr:hypothetical protein [Clostridiales bacterium]
MKALRIVIGVFRLIGSLSLCFPRLFINRRKGAAAFKEQLIGLDLDADVVSELAECYQDLGKLDNWIPKKYKNKAG